MDFETPYGREWGLMKQRIAELEAEVQGLRRPADFPKVVCLCGSGRFRDAYERAEFDKTLSGEIVLTIGCNTHDVAREPELAGKKPFLDELHKRKIDLCDYVFVLNVDGYIGDSTRSEIEYAEAHGKPVEYLEAKGGA